MLAYTKPHRNTSSIGNAQLPPSSHVKVAVPLHWRQIDIVNGPFGLPCRLGRRKTQIIKMWSCFSLEWRYFITFRSLSWRRPTLNIKMWSTKWMVNFYCLRRVAVPSDSRVVRGRRRAVVQEGEVGGEGATARPKDLSRRSGPRSIGELQKFHLKEYFDQRTSNWYSKRNLKTLCIATSALVSNFVNKPNTNVKWIQKEKNRTATETD